MEEEKKDSTLAEKIQSPTTHCSDPAEKTQMSKLTTRSKGGLITIPFILANESFEKVASYGLVANMILYLMQDFKMGLTRGTNILFFWSAATNFLPLLGAFASDSFLGRFLTIGLGSIASLLGMTMLWLTAMLRQAKPPPCDQLTRACETPTASQLTLLLSSFALMSVGAGGVRPCTMAFGADQIDRRGNPNRKRVLESFFGWYYASASLSILISFTGIIYIQDHFGWKVGFGVPAILMLVATLLFFLAYPIYVKQKARKSLFTDLAQVVVATYRNRKTPLPPRSSHQSLYYSKDSNYVVPSEKLRFLNKACIINNHEQDVNPDGSALNPWTLCTVEQVEQLKALVKVIPLWTTGLIMSINVSQSTFPVIQAKSMDRHLTSSFQIPAGSFAMFTIVTIVIWVLLYDRAIIPLASKIRGKPVRLGVKERMGIGIFFSSMAMVISAIVENIRRKEAISKGFMNNPNAVVEMSALWLVPQYCLHGLAEAFNAIAQSEFYYSEFPKTMSSIASSLFGLGMGVANLLASAILSTVNDVTSRGGKESWVSSNINKGRYENYYWLLAILSFVNFLYFILCSWFYGPCEQQALEVPDEETSSVCEEDDSSRFKNGIVNEVKALQVEQKPSDSSETQA